MNKFYRALLATMAGADLVIHLITPLFISAFIIRYSDVSNINQIIIVIAGFLSMMYRAVKPILKSNE